MDKNKKSNDAKDAVNRNQKRGRGINEKIDKHQKRQDDSGGHLHIRRLGPDGAEGKSRKRAGIFSSQAFQIHHGVRFRAVGQEAVKVHDGDFR